ncbi:amino acid ABC transporter substrate-binding protein [Alteromonas aestuariivivens]|uniref:Amino acid ABC transporter substrate-binding protein n=1 Tax=Alteromonas aestuariivivens TaxID=1938339 RepID=A0A3D8M7X6_9ALTE|nr:amino acid ABC transporter substrate-binding protein [Alteromonas aestuariivivens]RDV25272.1 amino acid ABC transporter substrate-binding protein [Alteromonas aestuariivivens]
MGKLVMGIAVMLLAGLSLGAQSATWSITYPRSLDDTDLRNEYPVALLTLALEKTGVKYRLLPSDRIMLQGKALRQLRENREVNVVWSMTDSQRERDLLPIRIPIAKGLIGWRVFLVTEQKLPRFSMITRKSDLLTLAPIQGEEWPDTKILQANGFNVFTVPTYQEAFSVLASNRGDFFPRSVIEVFQEMKTQNLAREIILEQDLALYYPTAMYFFVNKGNQVMARLLETGLRRAIEDGSFDALFFASYEETLKQLALDKRKVFVLENPLLPERTPLQDTQLWYQPSQNLLQ